MERLRLDKDAILKARIRAGHTQESAAHAIGLSRATIQNWERGTRMHPSGAHVLAAARVYGVDPNTLFTIEEVEQVKRTRPARPGELRGFATPPAEAQGGHPLDEFQPGQSQRETRRSE